MYIHPSTYTRAYADRKLTKKKEGMNVLEFVSITCQAVNPSASMDCFRLSLELHRSHIHFSFFFFHYEDEIHTLM